LSAAARILDRLDGVKPMGPGRWAAKCPAHADRSPSLSIREIDDGRVLLHDFGGCSTDGVLAAMGLTLSDLFDKPIEHYTAPSHSRVPARDVLELVSREIDVAMMLLTRVLDAKSISEPEWKRLAQASARIGRARDHVHGR
jgi:hypothetical protein